jgi:hypothetical protein
VKPPLNVPGEKCGSSRKSPGEKNLVAGSVVVIPVNRVDVLGIRIRGIGDPRPVGRGPKIDDIVCGSVVVLNPVRGRNTEDQVAFLEEASRTVRGLIARSFYPKKGPTRGPQLAASAECSSDSAISPDFTSQPIMWHASLLWARTLLSREMQFGQSSPRAC